MLPDANDFPACALERFGLESVTHPIGLNLFLPPGPICLGAFEVLAATMPKTPIYKDADALTAKDDVRHAPQR